jgi:hypothetical protein
VNDESSSKCSRKPANPQPQAMRGAGDSFGIAVRFYLHTERVPSTVIRFTYDVPLVAGNAKHAENARLMSLVFRDVQKCTRDRAIASSRLGLTIRSVILLSLPLPLPLPGAPRQKSVC